jgi:hypothetical protein
MLDVVAFDDECKRVVCTPPLLGFTVVGARLLIGFFTRL